MPVNSLSGISVLAVDHLHAAIATWAALKGAFEPAKPKKESLACAKAILELLHGLLMPHPQDPALNLNGIFRLDHSHVLCVATSRLLGESQVPELLLGVLDMFATDMALQQLDCASHNRAAVEEFAGALK